jgi:uncharacterized sporulation protein YeaH/YhbH (DUF444 family)
MWNIYCFHSSDGDSFQDEQECMRLVNEILDYGAKLFAYTEIRMDGGEEDPSTLYEFFEEEEKRQSKIMLSTMTSLEDVIEVLQLFLTASQYNSKVGFVEVG